MSSSGPAPSRKKMSGSGCHASWPPASMVAETARGLPMSPQAVDQRARLLKCLRRGRCPAGAHATRSPRASASVSSSAASAASMGERLLRVDVLPRLERGAGHPRMGGGRGEVQHDVDLPCPRAARRRPRHRGRAPPRAPLGASRPVRARDELEAVNAAAFFTYARLITPQPTTPTRADAFMPAPPGALDVATDVATASNP